MMLGAALVGALLAMPTLAQEPLKPPQCLDGLKRSISHARNIHFFHA
jgi:hypothetical protein